MAHDLIHLMRTFFLPAAVVQEAWQPATDIYRTPHGWLVKFDLAGVRPEDVRLGVEGRRLALEGVRRDECLSEGCRCQRLEIAYDRFERTILFPEEIQRARITTEFRLGFLLVRLQEAVR